MLRRLLTIYAVGFVGVFITVVAASGLTPIGLTVGMTAGLAAALVVFVYAEEFVRSWCVARQRSRRTR